MYSYYTRYFYSLFLQRNFLDIYIIIFDSYFLKEKFHDLFNEKQTDFLKLGEIKCRKSYTIFIFLQGKLRDILVERAAQ